MVWAPRDIDPLRLATGSVDAPVGTDVADRVHAWLRVRRIAGAVDHTPPRYGEGWTFLLLADEADRAVVLDPAGRAVAGVGLDVLRGELVADLGVPVEIDRHVVDDDGGGEDFADDASLDGDGPGDLDDAALEDADSRVLLFSRRGPGWAPVIAWRTGAEVETAVADGWSAFRYRGDATGFDIDPDRRELPQVLAVVPGDPAGTCYVDVTSDTPPWYRVGDAPGGHLVVVGLWDRLEPVFRAEEAGDIATRRLLEVLTDPLLLEDSEVGLLATDEELDVDIDRAHRALAPARGSEPAPYAERVYQLVTALGVPVDLASAGLADAPLSAPTRPAGFGAMVLQAADLGLAGLLPTGDPDGLLVRSERWLHERPALHAAVVLAEGGAAAALLGGARRRSGWRRIVLGALGLALLTDAVLAAVVVVRRTRREN